jgi:hypothetical protein
MGTVAYKSPCSTFDLVPLLIYMIHAHMVLLDLSPSPAPSTYLTTSLQPLQNASSLAYMLEPFPELYSQSPTALVKRKQGGEEGRRATHKITEIVCRSGVCKLDMGLLGKGGWIAVPGATEMSRPAEARGPDLRAAKGTCSYST